MAYSARWMIEIKYKSLVEVKHTQSSPSTMTIEFGLFCQDENTLFQIQEEELKSDPFRYKSLMKTKSFSYAKTFVHSLLY